MLRYLVNIQEYLRLHKLWLETDGQKDTRLIGKEADLRKADLRKADLRKADLRGADLRGANLFQADLSEANLWQANLSGANLSEANLSEANLSEANLSEARLSGANLVFAEFRRANLFQANLFQANLWTADLSDAHLSRADLRGANLAGGDLRVANLNGANLWKADLSRANFGGANLSRVNLSEVKALRTNFNLATLTGACIEDWHINTETLVKDIQCEYIYLKQNSDFEYDRNSDYEYEQFSKYEYVERRPSNEDAIFAAGDFVKLIRKTQSTVDLIFRNGIDWKALAISFDKFKIESDGAELTVRAIENKDDGDFVIQVDVPADANKSEIEKFLKQEYESAIKAIDTRYQERLSLKDEQAKFYLEQLSYERQEKTRLIEVVKIMAEQESQESSKNDLRGAIIGNFANTVRDNARQQTNQYNHTPEQKQNLADAASEIQQLLEQLSATYPTTTISEKTAVATKAVEAIEKNPNQKAKIVKAVKAGGIAALKELVSPVVQPVTNILFPILEALAADE